MHISEINVGDIVTIKGGSFAGAGTKILADFEESVIGKSDISVYVLIPKELGGQIIDNSIIEKFNISQIFIGKFGYYFMPNEIRNIKFKAPYSSNKKQFSSWKEFVYGRRILEEEKAKPPLNERAFEFI